MDFINSLSPARKKSLLAAAILLIIALVIAGFLRLKGSSETDAAASAASGAQSSEEDPQSDIPQSVAKTITPQSGGPANESGSLATDAEQARATHLSPVLTASALEKCDAQALEWTGDGTHPTGTPTLEDVHILSDDGAGNVTVSACVDSSNVRVLNDAGTALTDDTTMARALTYFLFVKDGGAWKLSGFSFPDDPTC